MNVWDEDEPAPLEQLKSEAELLMLVQHWRERAERAEELLRYAEKDVN